VGLAAAVDSGAATADSWEVEAIRESWRFRKGRLRPVRRLPWERFGRNRFSFGFSYWPGYSYDPYWYGYGYSYYPYAYYSPYADYAAYDSYDYDYDNDTNDGRTVVSRSARRQ